MNNYIQPGDTLTVVAPANVSSGDLVVVGSIVGVAAFDALSGADVEVATVGVYTLPKATADVVAQGALLYWDSVASNLTVTPGTDSKPLVGVAAAAAGNGVTTVPVRLMMAGQTGPSA